MLDRALVTSGSELSSELESDPEPDSEEDSSSDSSASLLLLLARLCVVLLPAARGSGAASTAAAAAAAAAGREDGSGGEVMGCSGEETGMMSGSGRGLSTRLTPDRGSSSSLSETFKSSMSPTEEILLDTGAAGDG